MQSGMPNKDGLVPPQGVGTERRKKVYPPIQWRPLRVMNPWHKFGILVGYWLAGALIMRLLLLAMPLAVAEIVLEPIEVVALVALIRSFRGVGEPVAPRRAWWRLTARPRAGWWLAALYLLGVAAFVRGAKLTVTDWMFAIENMLWAAAFLNSSIRLTIARRRGQ